jgi:putative phosphoesterase
MRLLILSDVHANPWALDAVGRDAGAVDHILCAGDCVNYGLAPGIVVGWLREHGAIAVRGNHDHAVAFHADPRASPAKQALALAMRDWTRRQLGDDDLLWLTRLPVSLHWELDGTRFVITHATPLEPLYDYRLTPELRDAMLDKIIGHLEADVLIVGHTHLPMMRRHGRLSIVNPGSVGQPLDGDPRASYAIWEDGRVTLRRVEYDLASPLDALSRLPLDAPIVDDLAHMLQHARVD